MIKVYNLNLAAGMCQVAVTGATMRTALWLSGPYAGRDLDPLEREIAYGFIKRLMKRNAS